MRYYVPLRKKMPYEEKRPSALVIPLWAWIGLVAALMLLVLALR
jgi:hypothetical protein